MMNNIMDHVQILLENVDILSILINISIIINGVPFKTALENLMLIQAIFYLHFQRK